MKKNDLLDFIKSAPTAWHAVDETKKRLLDDGYEELQETDRWQIKAGHKYFVIRNGSSLCAFHVPQKNPAGAHIVGSHTDSPSFKLKPNAEFRKANMTMLGTEVYGAPLLSSWLNRDLGLAGRVFFCDKKGKTRSELVCLDEWPVVIPQLAIHLDRGVNEEGLVLNKQEHLAALAGVDLAEPFLERLLEQKLGAETILSYDLFLFPIEPPALIGYKKQLISSYRIDSLLSVHAALEGLLAAKDPEGYLPMVVFWDNEEIGSNTAQGASSPFLTQVLERIGLGLGFDREDYLRFLRNSFCVSSDLAHALHPNYMDKHEPRHQPLFGGGIVIKSNAQQRYASDGYSVGKIVEICEKNKIPYQHFVSRNDVPCGTTIGPLQATLSGIPTVDIGCGQLSMHSAREVAYLEDYEHLRKLMAAFFKGKHQILK